MRARLVLVMAIVVAFAANSIVTRWLIIDQGMAPATTAWVRFVASGAAILWWTRGATGMQWRRTPLPAVALGIYAFALAFALDRIGAGPGTFVLFAAITVGILLGTWMLGHRIRPVGLAGVIVALAGVGVLAWNLGGGVGAVGVVAMAVSGLSWAGYTVVLRRHHGPVAGVARVHAVLALILLPMGFLMPGPWPWQGVVAAVAMGAVFTGLAYIAWQWVFPTLSGTTASVAQLSVPVVASAGGAFLLDETLDIWFAVAAVLVLVGAAISTRAQR